MRYAGKRKPSAKEVQDRALDLIQPLFKPSRSRKCSLPILMKIVMYAAANAISIFAACLRLGFVSDQTARSTLKNSLPKRRKIIEAKLNAAMNQSLPAAFRRRPRQLAIDYHEIPYHGHSPKNHTLGRKPRLGTSRFFTYATACLVDHGHRYTLAYTWVRAQDSTVDVLERLLDEVAKLGLKIRKVLLDRGFFSVEVMRFLQGRNLPFLMPAVMRGRKPGRGKKSTGWRTFLGKAAGWYRHCCRDKKEEVTVEVCVTYKSYRHHRTGKRRNKKLVYAAWKVRGAPREIREEYRKRFGIESSYRQLGQARIRTSTKNPILRLFFVGLGLLLRNLWVQIHSELFGESLDPKVRAKAKRLQFKLVLAIIGQMAYEAENAFINDNEKSSG